MEERLAESVVLRGAERGCCPLNADEAAETLDAALMREGVLLSRPLRLALQLRGIHPAAALPIMLHGHFLSLSWWPLP